MSAAGSCDYGPATLPRSYNGFGMGDTKNHSAWKEPLPPARFHQSREFLISDPSSMANNVPVKRESVV